MVKTIFPDASFLQNEHLVIFCPYQPIHHTEDSILYGCPMWQAMLCQWNSNTTPMAYHLLCQNYQIWHYQIWWLLWQQSTLTEISKIQDWQTQHTQCQVTLLELPNMAWHCQIAAIILAAKHLGENTKNPALTNPTFTAASHFARIPKSSIANSINCTGSKTPWWKYQKSGIHIMTYIRQHRHS